MELAWIWKSIFIVFAGMILLRFAGRKSISQMSVATTVIMISIGTTIVQPIANHAMWIAVGSATMFIISLIIIEYLQLKYDWFEKLMSGRSKEIGRASCRERDEWYGAVMLRKEGMSGQE